MGKKCDLCERSATKGATRSHSKIKTLKRQGINLQTKNIDGVKIKVCTSCMRTAVKPVKVKKVKDPATKPVKVEKKAKVKASK